MNDVAWDWFLAHNGYRLIVRGTLFNGQETRHVGRFLDAPVPYQTKEAFVRDFASEVLLAKAQIAEDLGVLGTVQL